MRLPGFCTILSISCLSYWNWIYCLVGEIKTNSIGLRLQTLGELPFHIILVFSKLGSNPKIMSERSNKPTPQRPEGQRILDAPMVAIDLNNLITQIKQEQSWKEKDRNAITVFKTDGLNLVLMALHQGAELKKHLAQGIITVQVLEGRIKFVTEDKTMERIKGEMLTLHEKIPHSVLAMEESVFLLTHASPKTVK